MAPRSSHGSHEFAETAPLAVVVDGASEEWDQNVLQIMAAPGCMHVDMAGRETVWQLKITQLLGSEPGSRT